MQFQKIGFFKKIQIKKEMKEWLSYEEEAGRALRKIEILGSFQHGGCTYFAAWFNMEQNMEHPAGEYIVVEDGYGTVISKFLPYTPESAMENAVKTAEFISEIRKNMGDPMCMLGFADSIPERYSKTPEDIVRRAMAYLLTCKAYQAAADRERREEALEKYTALLDKYGVRDSLFEAENQIISGCCTEEDLTRVYWYSEAVFAILWAARLNAGDILLMERRSLQEMYDSLQGSTIEELAQHVAMRDIPSIVDAMKDLMQLLMEETNRESREIAYERLRGLSWLFIDSKDWSGMMFGHLYYN